MKSELPQYFLICDARREQAGGRWRFVLRSPDAERRFEASDWEAEAGQDRLELLAVVRGLEALDQPARVTLITPSRYLSQGFNFGLAEWRASGWLWERFGEMVPVKHADLWQRVDQALRFHQVTCRTLRVDAAHRLYRQPHYGRPGLAGSRSTGGQPLSPRSGQRNLLTRLISLLVGWTGLLQLAEPTGLAGAG